MPLLYAFKSVQQPLEFVFPRKGPLDTHEYRVYGGVKQPLPPALGVLAVAGILGEVGDQARVEYALTVVRGIEAAIEIEVGASQI